MALARRNEAIQNIRDQTRSQTLRRRDGLSAARRRIHRPPGRQDPAVRRVSQSGWTHAQTCRRRCGAATRTTGGSESSRSSASGRSGVSTKLYPGMGQRNDRIRTVPTDCPVDAFRAADGPRSCDRGPEAPGKNPASKVRFAPLRETSHVYLTPNEISRLATLCGAQGDVVTILAYTGLRFGELTGLNVEDVDLAARRIRVRRSITQLSGRLIEGPPKSKAGRRSVPVPSRLIPLLERRLAGRLSGQPAITSPKGARLDLGNWKRSVRWRARILELGRPTMRVHDLRHTYASLARSSGADLKLVQVTMGHASITVTAHTYADLYDSDLDRVAEAMDELGGESADGG